MNPSVSPVDLADKAPSQALMIDHERLAALCRRHHIRQLSLFGSRLKGTARHDSDVDLLVDFEPGTGTTLFDMVRIEMELGDLLGGKTVDLRTAAELSRFFRDEVISTAVPQYVAA